MGIAASSHERITRGFAPRFHQIYENFPRLRLGWHNFHGCHHSMTAGNYKFGDVIRGAPRIMDLFRVSGGSRLLSHQLSFSSLSF